MKIILTGYMGAGKTAIGTSLAAKFQLSFFDLDREIEKVEKRSIPEIFSQSGEIYFRRKETQVLSAFLLSGPEKFVLSVGGGTPCYGMNLQLMNDSPGISTIYLKTSLEELTRRLYKERNQRPLIAHLDSEVLLKDFIRKHLFERAYYYNQSDFVVDTDRKNIDKVCQEIVDLLE